MRLFQTRRSGDTVQKQKIKEAAAILADVLVKHLEQRPFGKRYGKSMYVFRSSFPGDKVSLFSYYTSMISATTILLVEGMDV